MKPHFSRNTQSWPARPCARPSRGALWKGQAALRLLGALLSLTVAVAGCGEANSGTGGEARSSARDRFHEHDHHVAEHRPADFPAAVDQISERFDEFRKEYDSGDREHALEDLAALLDIVRWLPEIAADSDLPETPWNRVREIAQRLDGLLTRYVDQRSDRAPATVAPDDAMMFAADVDALQQIVDRGEWFHPTYASYQQVRQYEAFMRARAAVRGVPLPADVPPEDPQAGESASERSGEAPADEVAAEAVEGAPAEAAASAP